MYNHQRREVLHAFHSSNFRTEIEASLSDSAAITYASGDLPKGNLTRVLVKPRIHP